MKKRHIDCLIKTEIISVLKNLEAQNASFLFNTFGNYVIGFKLECNGEKYYINNTPNLKDDNDEYPVLEMYSKNNFDKLYDKNNFDKHANLELKNTKVQHIFLIRDNVSFIRDDIEFNVISDIGIKFITNAIDIMLIMEDSIGGFIDIYIGRKLSLFDSQLELKDQWAFKADEDEFKNLKREEIKIF